MPTPKENAERGPQVPRPDKVQNVHNPPQENVLEKAAAPMATISSHADPWPHYAMALGCGGGAGYAYYIKNMRATGIAAGFSLAYLYAGRLLAGGNTQMGYDLGTVASLALVATAGPTAWATGEGYSVAMASLGGLSSIGNLVKSYQLRTGKPHEMGYEEKSQRH